MNAEEEYGRADRIFGIETDDEDNEAQISYEGDSDSDSASAASETSAPSRNPSLPDWPESFRSSMDMYACITKPITTPTSGGLLKRSWFKAGKEGNSSVLPVDNKSLISPVDSSLVEPLVDGTRIDKEDKEASTHSLKISSGSRLSSITELPAPQLCTYSQSLFNAINALCGIGILSTPYAIKEGGWLSTLLLFMFGMITCYTGILLKRCLDSSSNIHTYPDIGQAAFGTSGRIWMALILYIELYSSCVEFLIMMSDNLASFFPNVEVDIAGIHLNSYQICAITCALVILPTVWLRNLSLLSYISVGGVAALIVVVLCLLWVGVTGEVGFHPTGTALNLSRLPITVGIYSFCYGSHSVFPNIYTSMEERSRFPSILAISFTVAVLVYAGIGVGGYLMFGEATKNQFTLNLPKDSVATSIAGWTVIVTPLTKFALSITPVALAVEELVPSTHRSPTMSILIRTALLFSSLVIALTVPDFGSVMAFIGSFLVMLVSIILPCICYMRLGEGKLTKLETTTCTFIIIVGVISAIVGTYSSISSMAG